MSKLHMKVIQRNGVDIFVTSSMEMKEPPLTRRANAAIFNGNKLAYESMNIGVNVEKPTVRCRNGQELFKLSSPISLPFRFNYA